MAPHANDHLATHGPPPALMHSLEIAGYQLLFEIGGVGVGRQGSNVFLLVAEDVADGVELNSTHTHLAFHQARFRDEAELAQWTALTAQLGFLRLSGWRLVLTRSGLRSRIDLLNPSTGGVAASLPDKCGGSLFGARKAGPGAMLAALRGLQPPESIDRTAATQEQLYGLYLALAMGDPDRPAAQAVELADRAWELSQADPSLDPRAALDAARHAQLN